MASCKEEEGGRRKRLYGNNGKEGEGWKSLKRGGGGLCGGGVMHCLPTIQRRARESGGRVRQGARGSGGGEGGERGAGVNPN